MRSLKWILFYIRIEMQNSQIESIGFNTGSSKGKGSHWRGSRVIAEPRFSIRPIMPIMGESTPG
jgi:hypothetical protein